MRTTYYIQAFAPIVVALVSLVLMILLFIFVVPEKKRASLGGFGKFLHDTVNFKYLIIEKILQAFYIFVTIYVFGIGFCRIILQYQFRVAAIIEGVLIMLLGPIVIRVAYELIMMAILLVKNVIQINNKLRYPAATTAPVAPVVPSAAEPAAPVTAAVPTADPIGCGGNPTPAKKRVFCPYCGTEQQGEDEFCFNCGRKIG